MAEYACPETLIETQWLASHLDDPTVRIVEVDTSIKPYKDAHIPGAVFWNIFSDLLLPDLSMNLDPANFSKLLSRSGISSETTVVAYGSYPDTGSWIFWLLKYFGHDRVRVLNGGYQKWVAEGRPLAPTLSTYLSAEYSMSQTDDGLRAFQTDVIASIERSDSVLVDARSLQEYSGDLFMMKPPEKDERGGHIPGAVYVEHTLALNEDGTFKSSEELQALYAEKGVVADKEVISYCAIGARSASTWFVLKYLLGYPTVRNYDGSWNQWSRLPNVSVEKIED